MVKIYLDGADLNTMAEFSVDGYTTNPTLCRKAGITNYREFGKLIAEKADGKPVSIEVLADTPSEIYDQAREIATWAENIWVKVPVMTTDGTDTYNIIRRLANDGIKLNVTAIMTLQQVRSVARYLSPLTPAIISIFAGRIADTGRDPMSLMNSASQVKHDTTEVLWASAREVYNVKQAEQCGTDIITLSPDLIRKMSLFGKDLHQYSRETVKMFFDDAKGMTL